MGVKVPLMYTKGKFQVLEDPLFTAVALPLDKTFIKVLRFSFLLKRIHILKSTLHFFKSGEMIVILPKHGQSFFDVEEKIASSGISLLDTIQQFLSYK